MSDSVRPHRRRPTRLPRPWDSPGKNPGVSCHFLLQCMKVKSESEVAQSCLTLRDPMICSLPGSSVHGIFQARVLEWGAIAFSNQQPRKEVKKTNNTGSALSTNLQVGRTYKNFQRCEYAFASPITSGVSETAAGPPSPMAVAPSVLPAPTSFPSPSQ